MSDSVMSADGLCFSRSGRDILDSVSIRIGPGERVAVVGPSGSGKTSLLTILACVQRPDSGQVLLEDAPLSGPGPRVALVLQGYGLLPLLTATENVQIALRAADKSAEEAVDAAERTLEQMGLGPFVNHLIEDMSGGQQQRVAVARALALRPLVLLADEPTAEQDAANRELVVGRLLHPDSHDAAVVIATHDLEIAQRCDRIVELHRGQVVAG